MGNDPIEKHPGEPAQRWFWGARTSSLGQKLLQTLWVLPGIRQGGAKYTSSWKELDWIEGSSVDIEERRLLPRGRKDSVHRTECSGLQFIH